MKTLIHIVTDSNGVVKYVSLDREKALDYAFEHQLIIEAFELDVELGKGEN